MSAAMSRIPYRAPSRQRDAAGISCCEHDDRLAGGDAPRTDGSDRHTPPATMHAAADNPMTLSEEWCSRRTPPRAAPAGEDATMTARLAPKAAPCCSGGTQRWMTVTSVATYGAHTSPPTNMITKAAGGTFTASRGG